MLRLVRNRSHSLIGAVRYAGGGGRPQGRPVLNFKQRRELGLPDKDRNGFIKSPKLKMMGNFEDIEKWVDKSAMVDITDLDEWESPSMFVEDKKVIVPSSLFGPSKAANRGSLPKKSNVDGNKFSHKRIFGVSKDKQ